MPRYATWCDMTQWHAMPVSVIRVANGAAQFWGSFHTSHKRDAQRNTLSGHFKHKGQNNKLMKGKRLLFPVALLPFPLAAHPVAFLFCSEIPAPPGPSGICAWVCLRHIFLSRCSEPIDSVMPSVRCTTLRRMMAYDILAQPKMRVVPPWHTSF